MGPRGKKRWKKEIDLDKTRPAIVPRSNALRDAGGDHFLIYFYFSTNLIFVVQERFYISRSFYNNGGVVDIEKLEIKTNYFVEKTIEGDERTKFLEAVSTGAVSTSAVSNGAASNASTSNAGVSVTAGISATAGVSVTAGAAVGTDEMETSDISFSSPSDDASTSSVDMLDSDNYLGSLSDEDVASILLYLKS